MRYDLNTPVKKEDAKRLRIGDVVYLTGEVFTARDSAHHMLFKKNKEDIPFDISEMVLYHSGPLVKKNGKGGWCVVSAGPTTSSRMEELEDYFIKNFNINLIIGKGGMGRQTKKALQKYTCVYTSFTGGAGALAADKIKKVKDVFWLEELGMAEAIWIFEVEKFGPLVISMDSHGNSLFDQRGV